MYGVLDSINEGISWFSFILTLILEGFLFFRFKFRFDKEAIIQLIAYLLVMFSRT
jgi:hypothetical protein